MDEVEEASKLAWERRREMATRTASPELPLWEDADPEAKDQIRADMRRLLDGHGLQHTRPTSP